MLDWNTPNLDDASRVASDIRKFRELADAARFLSGRRLFCSRCVDLVEVEVQALYAGGDIPDAGQHAGPPLAPLPLRSPSLFAYRCKRCARTWYALLAIAPPESQTDELYPLRRSRLVLLPVTPALTSQSVDPEANFYFREAETARYAGAHTAAMAMYRSAVEAFLGSIGFQDRSLDHRIAAFEAARANGTLPADLQQLPQPALNAVRIIGNFAVHAGWLPQQRKQIGSELTLAAAQLVTVLLARTKVDYWRTADAIRALAEAEQLLQYLRKAD